MYLAALSCNFRLIAFATSKSKGVVTRLCYWLSEKDQNRASIVFDAVYVLQRQKRERPNITHALQDFYDDSQGLAEYSSQKVVIMCPEKFNSSHEQQTKPFDLREFFVVDKDYYFGKYAPLIILIPHSRIRT